MKKRIQGMIIVCNTQIQCDTIVYSFFDGGRR
jgi:hypothetical protein